ncbi:DUF7146 domain-containing protein [Oricola thermophila]|uniref:DUF7146 domain-containing protein n=1 Tax=Oricola thermophila TaxID=2742145 RepID=UPI001FE90219|nr:P4 alpha zinc-binding domain-containing protein [Oricola thermophila]
MSAATDAFIEEARAVGVLEAFDRAGGQRGGLRRAGAEWIGPCPVAGGRDGFAIHPGKNAWNCRKCGVGGKDGIGLVAHMLGHDVRTRDGFLSACAAVLMRDPPDGSPETPEARAARERAVAEAREKAERAAAAREREQNAFREREIARAQRIVFAASALREGDPVKAYLRARGADLWQGVPTRIKFHADLPYWADRETCIGAFPAMVIPFMAADGALIGCHCTWIDLSNPPKFRRDFGVDEAGCPRPSKKMRGRKKGGILPLAGHGGRARRWVVGEGVENTLAVALCEGFRGDTFYAAAGDLGNLAGKADPASRFRHPTERRTDALGRSRPVFVPGPEPDWSAEAMPVLDHVEALVLLADADSEPVFTASAMARARKRHGAPGRTVAVAWPAPGHGDFSEWVSDGMREGLETA